MIIIILSNRGRKLDMFDRISQVERSKILIRDNGSTCREYDPAFLPLYLHHLIISPDQDNDDIKGEYIELFISNQDVPWAIELIAIALNMDDPKVKMRAITWLSYFGGQRSETEILKALHDHREDIHWAAVAGLRLLRSNKVLSNLGREQLSYESK